MLCSCRAIQSVILYRCFVFRAIYSVITYRSVLYSCRAILSVIAYRYLLKYEYDLPFHFLCNNQQPCRSVFVITPADSRHSGGDDGIEVMMMVLRW